MTDKPKEPFNRYNSGIIEPPDTHEVGGAKELYCWMPGNGDNQCDGSCVAFDERCLTSPELDSCKILNLLRVTTGYLGKLVGFVRTREMSEAWKTPPPPKVK